MRFEPLMWARTKNAGGGSGGSSAPADWNAKEGEAGYVKNRTHWEEEGVVEILPETAVVMDDYFEAQIENSPALTAGDAYIIKWNGADFNCVAVSVDIGGVVGVFVGDVWGGTGGQYGTESTGEPFMLGYAEAFGGLMVASLDESTEATLSIFGNGTVIHHLDPQYIKDMYYEGAADPIIDNQTFEFDTSGLADGYSAGTELTFPKEKGLVVGDMYTVVWDGAVYSDVVCLKDSFNPVLGSTWEDWESGNSEYPFIVSTDVVSQNYGMMEICTMSSANEHTISIIPQSPVVHKIDPKYLPDGCGRTYLTVDYGNNYEKLKYYDSDVELTAAELVQLFETTDLVVKREREVDGYEVVRYERVTAVDYHPNDRPFAEAEVGGGRTYVTSEYVQNEE